MLEPASHVSIWGESILEGREQVHRPGGRGYLRCQRKRELLKELEGVRGRQMRGVSTITVPDLLSYKLWLFSERDGDIGRFWTEERLDLNYISRGLLFLSPSRGPQLYTVYNWEGSLQVYSSGTFCLHLQWEQLDSFLLNKKKNQSLEGTWLPYKWGGNTPASQNFLRQEVPGNTGVTDIYSKFLSQGLIFTNSHINS